MFSHITLGSNDLDQGESFYTPLLATIGMTVMMDWRDRGVIIYSGIEGEYPRIFINTPYDRLPATWGNGFHIAFNAPDQQAVDAFYRAAMQHGGICEGEPGPRPEYSEGYYAAYVRDPVGNKLQAKCYISGPYADEKVGGFSHITLGLGDTARESQLYRAMLAPLGISQVNGDDDFAAFVRDGDEMPYLYVKRPFDGRPTSWGNGVHLAFRASNRKMVDEFYTAALENGATCEGPPGPRDYTEHYYGAFVRDAVGNKLQAVCRGGDDEGAYA